MKLPPNDDAALIAASNLACGVHVKDHGADACDTCEASLAAFEELKRREADYRSPDQLSYPAEPGDWRWNPVLKVWFKTEAVKQ